MDSLCFASALKDGPPPHPGEDRSTKKVKLRDDQNMQDTMETVDSPPSIPESPLSATSTPDFVPETQMTSIMPTPAEASRMKLGKPQTEASVPSFKLKVLSNAKSKAVEDELVLQQGDVVIGMNGNMPTVNFASHIIDLMNKRMGFAVIIKLLGRTIGYRSLLTQIKQLRKSKGEYHRLLLPAMVQC